MVYPWGRAILAVWLIGAVGVSCAAQSAPFGAPKKEVTKADESKRAQKTAASQQEQKPGASKAPIVNQAHSPAHDEHKGEAAEDANTQRLLASFTGLLVLVGFLQVGALVWQVIVFRRTLDAIKLQTGILSDTAQRQLRAYVLVSSAQLKFKRPDAPEVQVNFRNFGQTPAYEVRGWISIWIERYPLGITLPEAPQDFRKGTETLAPSRVSIFVASKSPPVPAQSIRLLGTPEGTVYVYGEIRYKNAFGTARCTKYRLMFGGAEPVQTSITDGYKTALLKPDVEGNEAN